MVDPARATRARLVVQPVNRSRSPSRSPNPGAGRAGTAGSEGPWRSNAPGLPDEVWFGIIERQAVRRGSFPSVRDLMIKIRGFIDGWNRRKHPFIWTKPADDILARIDRKRKHIMKTGHSSGHR